MSNILEKYILYGDTQQLISNFCLHPCLTWEFIEKYSNNFWYVPYYIPQNPNITMDIVKNNPQFPWKYESLSKNPNLTWEYISSTKDQKWDYEYI